MSRVTAKPPPRRGDSPAMSSTTSPAPRSKAAVSAGRGKRRQSCVPTGSQRSRYSAASLAVTTTQSGAAQTYAYPLAVEPAAELTNGRFVLGKGLRGRHFAFELQMQARSGVINDLRVDAAPTKRRV